MTLEERRVICRELAILSMWGHGWIGSSLMERLDEHLPDDPTWSQLYSDLADQAQRGHIGTIGDEARLNEYLRRGYWLCNFDDKGCALFNPPPMNGLAKYVAKPLAEKYKPHWAR